MFTNNVNWRAAVKNAAHYKAVGITDLYLSGPDTEDRPWEFAVAVGEGGMHRLVGSVSARITAIHPCGLEFSWGLDYETSEASGKGTYSVDREGLASALRQLSTPAREQLSERLIAFAEAVHQKGIEYQGYADTQFAQAASIREFIKAGA